MATALRPANSASLSRCSRISFSMIDSPFGAEIVDLAATVTGTWPVVGFLVEVLAKFEFVTEEEEADDDEGFVAEWVVEFVVFVASMVASITGVVVLVLLEVIVIAVVGFVEIFDEEELGEIGVEQPLEAATITFAFSRAA